MLNSELDFRLTRELLEGQEAEPFEAWQRWQQLARALGPEDGLSDPEVLADLTFALSGLLGCLWDYGPREAAKLIHVSGDSDSRRVLAKMAEAQLGGRQVFRAIEPLLVALEVDKLTGAERKQSWSLERLEVAYSLLREDEHANELVAARSFSHDDPDDELYAAKRADLRGRRAGSGAYEVPEVMTVRYFFDWGRVLFLRAHNELAKSFFDDDECEVLLVDGMEDRAEWIASWYDGKLDWAGAALGDVPGRPAPTTPAEDEAFSRVELAFIEDLRREWAGTGLEVSKAS